MDEDGTIFQLAFRLGFVIPLNQHPAAYFYWVMRQVINKYTLTSSYNPNLKEIINMDYQTYLGWVKEQGEQIYKYRGESGYFKHGDLRTTDAYHQRLLMFL